MRYLLWCIAGLYGVLSAAAAVAKVKHWKTSPSLTSMFIGGMGLLAALVLKSSGNTRAWILGLAALVCIAAAAWKNSALAGRRHMVHHIVRWCLSLIILIGMIVY